MSKLKCQIDILSLAKFLLWFGREHGDCFTHLKLQKLCYYAEAMHLAMYDTPLTGEPFEAWAHGPVSRSLWEKYKKYKWDPIPYKGSEPKIPAGIKSFLAEFFESFSGYSAYQLEKLSHNEAPWLEARGDISPEKRCSNVISSESMKVFYKKYIKDN
ncbi:MAG TPA: DUF4065 domain-containing protein [bacterium]|nr:DUF4065 domain-containing protein [bacterium]